VLFCSVKVPLPSEPPLICTVLSNADRLIGKLAGEGGRLPNPHILMRPFLQREGQRQDARSPASTS
jgi:hypothetical protein